MQNPIKEERIDLEERCAIAKNYINGDLPKHWSHLGLLSFAIKYKMALIYEDLPEFKRLYPGESKEPLGLTKENITDAIQCLAHYGVPTYTVDLTDDDIKNVMDFRGYIYRHKHEIRRLRPLSLYATDYDEHIHSRYYLEMNSQYYTELEEQYLNWVENRENKEPHNLYDYPDRQYLAPWAETEIVNLRTHGLPEVFVNDYIDSLKRMHSDSKYRRYTNKNLNDRAKRIHAFFNIEPHSTLGEIVAYDGLLNFYILDKERREGKKVSITTNKVQSTVTEIFKPPEKKGFFQLLKDLFKG